jgi:hypothetical protein
VTPDRVPQLRALLPWVPSRRARWSAVCSGCCPIASTRGLQDLVDERRLCGARRCLDAQCLGDCEQLLFVLGFEHRLFESFRGHRPPAFWERRRARRANERTTGGPTTEMIRPRRATARYVNLNGCSEIVRESGQLEL